MKTFEKLKSDIARLARGGAGLNEERKQLIQDAGDSRDLVPDNWAEDGSFKRARSWTTGEKRETANDVFAALEGVVEDAYRGSYDRWSIWVQDWYGSGSDDDPWTVVFMLSCDLYTAPFTWGDDGKITLGDAVKVRPVTSYVERKQPTALKEWRKKKADTMRGGLERREFSAEGLEIREKDDDTWELTGWASVTDTPYEVGFYTETLERSAFTRTLGENPDVQLLINHEGLPLARTLSATMTLEARARDDGKIGLHVRADLDKLDPDAQRLERKMRRKDIDAMSFAFSVTDQRWNDDYTERTIKSVSLHRGDVSVVNQGANPAAVASIRSQDAITTLRGIGGDGLVAALTEWRDYTLLAAEQRAGKALSAATMETLSQVANLMAVSDEALDEAQPLLADLMGVPNPDEPEPDEPDDGEARAAVIPDYTTRARQEIDGLMLTRSAR